MKRLEEEEEEERRQMMLRREYSYMLDDEEEECGYREAGQGKKKRRLSVEQVKALEKSFEVENKVETERKEKLAQQLGLEPRQVAVWFQNRRARWKTKLLEKDYASLHSQFQLLKHNYDSLLHDKHSLLSKIKHLKSKLSEDNNTKSGVKEEVVMDINTKDGIQTCLSVLEYDDDDDSKASESDSSAILNDNDNANNSSSSGGDPELVENGEEQLIWMSPNSPSLRLDNSSSSCLSAGYTREFWASESNVCSSSSSSHIVVKLEEQDHIHMYVNGEDACNLFSDDEVPPTQHWYTPGPPPDHWTGPFLDA